MVKTVVNPHRCSSPVPYNSVFKLTLVPQVNTKTSLVLFKDKIILAKDEFSIQKLIEEVFKLVMENLQNRGKIADYLTQYMGDTICPDDIGYDAYAQTFHFTDWNEPFGSEYMFFSQHFQHLKEAEENSFTLGYDRIAKYTSLETALTILKSGKMRMMSVTAMNDKKEIGHLYGNLSNSESSFWDDKTIIHFARQRYLTSFTSKIDDLTMWRLYGNKGQGVCLLFSSLYSHEYHFPVDYSGEKSKIIKESKQICKDLENLGIKFTFKSIKTLWQYFLKPEGFSDEKEYRYLRIEKTKPDGYILASNGVVSGYKDFALVGEDTEDNDVFPARLEGIILGPNMKNVDINRFQLETVAHENGIPLLKGVTKSSIDYFMDDL